MALGTSVFAERDGKILLLKRAMGEATGAWYLPGGAVDPGETPEIGAVRELLEEAALVPDGELEQIGFATMKLYGTEMLIAFFACVCSKGDVKISDEHSDWRWMDPVEFRERYFNDEVIAKVAAAQPRFERVMRGNQQNIDRYLKQRSSS